MGTLTAGSILDKVRIPLNDADKVRWPDAELLGWLNEGQRAIVSVKHNAYVKRYTVRLSAGTYQPMPADGIELIDIVRNMGVNGDAPGRAIRIVDRDKLDSRSPNWHSATANAEAQHFMYSPANPKVFYVYPPQPDNAAERNYVDMIYTATPPNVASTAATIALDDIWEPALIEYVLYRAFAKDAEFSADKGQVTAHINAFVAMVGGKAKAEAGADPNTATTK